MAHRKSTGRDMFHLLITLKHSGDNWMYPYQRTCMGNPYVSPISRGYLFVIPKNPKVEHQLNTMVLLMAEILHQLIGSLSHYLQGFIYPKWLFGISAINSSTRTVVSGAPPGQTSLETSNQLQHGILLGSQ